MIKKGLLLFLLSISLVSVFSQSNPQNREKSIEAKEGIISGTVLDKQSNIPMEYVNIAVFSNKDSSLVNGGITNQKGKFFIDALPYGKYYVVVNFIGYKKQIFENIALNPNKAYHNMETILLETAAQQLEGFEVVAEKDAVEFKIDKKVINVGLDIAAAGGSAVDALENAPSVQVDIEGNVTLRGSGSFLVLIDGKPSALTGSDALEQIPASAIENIEIITNPSAKYDPDGMGGIINVVLKKKIDKGFSGVFNTTIGIRDKYRGDFLLSYRTKKINYFIGADFSDNKRYGSMLSINRSFSNPDTAFVTETSGDRNRKRKGYNIKGGIEFDLSKKTSLSLSGDVGSHSFGRDVISSLRYYDEVMKTNEIISGTEDFFNNESIMDRGNNYYRGTLNFQHLFSGQKHKLDAVLYYSTSHGEDTETQDEYPANANFENLTNTPTNSTYSLTDESGWNFRFSTDYKRPLSEKYTLETGLQIRLDRDTENFNFNTRDSVSGEWIRDSLFSSSMDFEREIYAAYATLMKEGEVFSWMLGLRGEYTDRTTIVKNEAFTIQRADFFPSVHTSYKLPKDYELMLSYSRRINRPHSWYLNPFPTYINAYNIRYGNHKLEPEYVNSMELSALKRIKTSYITTSLYYRNSRNLITRIGELRDDTSNVMIHTFENLDQDHSLGMEFMANVDVKKWYSFNLSGNYYYYTIEGDIIEDDAVKESWNYDFRLNNTFKLKTGTRIQLTAMYNSPTVSAQGERSGFFYTNLAIRQDFLKKQLSATLQIRDLLGTAKHEFTSYGTNFSGFMEFIPESPVFMLTLSYKLNNFKKMKFDDGGGMDSGGGGEDVDL